MRNLSMWIPSKVVLDCCGRLRIPGRPGGVGAGSILVATLLARWYAEILPAYACGRLLEVGSGRLPFYALYASKVDEVIATDWPESLHGSEFMDFACNLEAGLPLRDTCMDAVIASDVLEHVYRPKLVLTELYRVLRPGGIVMLNTPFLYWVHEAPYDYYRYTPQALRRMAEEAGFEVVRLDALGGALCVCIDLVAKSIQRVPLLGRILARSLQYLCLACLPNLPSCPIYPLQVAAVLRKRGRQGGHE